MDLRAPAHHKSSVSLSLIVFSSCLRLCGAFDVVLMFVAPSLSSHILGQSLTSLKLQGVGLSDRRKRFSIYNRGCRYIIGYSGN